MAWISHTIKTRPQEHAYENMGPTIIWCYFGVLGIRKLPLDVLVILLGIICLITDYLMGIYQSIN